VFSQATVENVFDRAGIPVHLIQWVEKVEPGDPNVLLVIVEGHDTERAIEAVTSIDLAAPASARVTSPSPGIIKLIL
jgi:hypothetical protein